jgi:hypothetical protein
MLKAKTIAVACSLVCFSLAGRAAGLECPDSGAGGVALSPSQAKILTQGEDTDFSNEIGDLIVSLKTGNPDMPYRGLVDAATAAFCPYLAKAPLDAAQKMRRMREFEQTLRERLNFENPPRATAILAQVQISPQVYRSLRDKAGRAGQTPSQFMAALLTKAASESPEN